MTVDRSIREQMPSPITRRGLLGGVGAGVGVAGSGAIGVGRFAGPVDTVVPAGERLLLAGADGTVRSLR